MATSNENNNNHQTDPMSGFWSDMMSRMAAMGMGSPGGGDRASAEMQQQMRRMFFDAWAKYCDDFMRSEQFLQMMKQSVDSAVAFKKQTDEWLSKTVEGLQMPSRGDVHEVVAAASEMEKRINRRLDALMDRLEAIESAVGGSGKQTTHDSAPGTGGQAASGTQSRKSAGGSSGAKHDSTGTRRSGGSRRRSS